MNAPRRSIRDTPEVQYHMVRGHGFLAIVLMFALFAGITLLNAPETNISLSVIVVIACFLLSLYHYALAWERAHNLRTARMVSGDRV